MDDILKLDTYGNNNFEKLSDHVLVADGAVTVDNLLSRAEVSARWRETNHTDPVGYFAGVV